MAVVAILSVIVFFAVYFSMRNVSHKVKSETQKQSKQENNNNKSDNLLELPSNMTLAEFQYYVNQGVISEWTTKK